MTHTADSRPARRAVERPPRRVLGDLLACRQPYQGLRRRLLAAAVGRS